MSPRTKAKSIGFIALSLLVHSSLLASLMMSQDTTVKEAGIKGAPENGGENTMVVDLEAAGASPNEGATESATTTESGEPKQPLLANADDEQAIPVAATIENKPEFKTEAKVEAKVEPKVEAKPEPQPEPQKPVEKVVEVPPQPKPEPVAKPKPVKKPVAKVAKPKPAPQPIVETSEELPPIETSSAPQTEDNPEWIPSNEPTQEEAYREELNEETEKRSEPEPEMLSPSVVDSEPEAETAAAPLAAASASGAAATNAASKPEPMTASPASGTISGASAPSNIDQPANGAGKSSAGTGTGAGNGQGSGAFAGLQGSPIVEASLRRPLPGNPLPAYPQQDRLRGHEGMAVVVGKVEANGIVSEVQLERASGSALMDSAALKTFRAWKFAPDRQTALVRKSFQFSLKGDAQNAPAELRRQLGQSPNPESAKAPGL